jgi:poly(A) polymerase
LLVRYSSKDGKTVKTACVYTFDEHGVPRNSIDPDALRIIDKLRASGHSAYVVGGAVRDLLIGKKPKDFDIVTDAQPGRIKKIFWNARIIGRRFRLVHIYFDAKIFEVSTFRSIKDGTVGNTYGTIEEDVRRRDFTLNALYYDPKDQTIVDYVGGFKDIKARKLKPLIPLKTIFREDPVRMIRAAKYAAVTGFSLGFFTRRTIASSASLLQEVSPSRITEEIIKMLASGRSELIFSKLSELGLLPFIQPNAAAMMKVGPQHAKNFLRDLAALDEAANEKRETRLGRQMAFLLDDFLGDAIDWEADPLEAFKSALHESREFVKPMNPPKVELECAVRAVFRRRGVPLMQKPRPASAQAPRPRRKR